MLSRISPRHFGFDHRQDASQSPVIPPPPPPPRDGSREPLPTRHTPRLPGLDTTTSYVPGTVSLTTPLTATSLSSPFTQSSMPATMPGVSRHGVLTRGVSPAANRMSGHYNIQYDPRDWSGNVQHPAPRRPQDQGENGIDEPPPPYTRPANDTTTATRHDASVLPRHGTVLSPDRSQSTTPVRHPILQHASYATQQEMTNLPPPPRRVATGSLVTNNVEHIQSQPLYGRRSTSAGPSLVTAFPQTTRAPSTSSSQQPQQEWTPGMPLPGPPSVPPPSSSRSQSATTQSSSRHRPARLHIRDSNLATIPATPADANLTTFERVGLSLPLRLDTNSVGPHCSEPPQLVDTIGPPVAPGSSGLARRSAIRGSSLNRVPRGDSHPQADPPLSSQEPPSSTMSNNPWASALDQVRSPDTFVEPANTSSRTNLTKMNSRIGSGGQMGTPPITPSLNSQKSQTHSARVVSEQAKTLPTPPLSQKPLNSANSLALQRDTDRQDDDQSFANAAIERHTEFVRRELNAGTDTERLALFVEYMQTESVIRRERYAAAYQSDHFNVDAAKSMLFGDPSVRRASTRGGDTPSVSVAQSPAQLSNPSSARGESFAVKDYKPALSTIASVEPDEMSSRGRAPSRWWESQTGSNYGEGQGPAVKRSKRESKYMSLSKQLLQNMEMEMDPVPEDGPWIDTEYPQEKLDPGQLGYYNEETSVPTPPTTSRSLRKKPSKAMDISRFITLPPPYPRHYPAVNNSHPDLAEYRSSVRKLSDLEDAQGRYARHAASVEAMRIERQKKLVETRKVFKAGIRNQIEEGTMSYSDAAEAEKTLKAKEHDMDKQGLQAEFDFLQDVVINPLHEQFNQRVAELNRSIHSLQKELFASAANQDPDQPVQEGDDVPELLEQLTQLKWLFEAREHLHQELFELLSKRNDTYKAIVALPYKQAGNNDKVRDTEAFFDKDAATRHAAFCAESVKRHKSFLNFIEDNASRGIELQSSAFWDITPGLVDLVQKLPTDLAHLDIHIPEDELTETPSYQKYPQQYLYLLLRHAQQSSYPYIEGQVNLHCLAHEVKTAQLAAEYNEARAQQRLAGDQSSESDMSEARLQEEAELNSELKNRASLIEEQWQDALGKYLIGMQDKVREYLEANGGWDDFDTSEA